MLKNALENLLMHGIKIYPNVMEQFFINGFKRQGFYVDIISNIKTNIINITNDNIHWVNIRSFRKANNREKNIIICFFLFIYHERFIKYLKEFLIQDCKSNEQNVNNLILKLEKIFADNSGNLIPTESIMQNDQNKIEIVKSLNEQEIVENIKTAKDEVHEKLTYYFSENVKAPSLNESEIHRTPNEFESIIQTTSNNQENTITEVDPFFHDDDLISENIIDYRNSYDFSDSFEFP